MKGKTIKPVFLRAMKNDPGVRERLAVVNNCSPFTITRWLRDNNPRLTTVSSLLAMKSHFGLLEIGELLDAEGVEEMG